MIRLGIFDAAGNGGSDAVAVKLDTIQPIAKILTPADACYNYRAVPHVFTFGDPEPGGRLTSIPMPDWFGPRVLEIESPAEGFIGPLSTGVDARSLYFTYDDSMISSAVRFTGSHGVWQIEHAEDLHHIALGINDHAGNAAPVQTHSYYVDVTSPENRVEHTPPGYDGFFLPQSNVSLDFYYRDPPPKTNPTGLQSGLVLSSFGAGMTNLTPPPGAVVPPLVYNFMASDPGSFHVDLPYLPDGRYSVNSTVADCATNRANASNEFFIDTHPPTAINIYSPSTGQFLSAPRPTVWIYCEDPYPSSGNGSFLLHTVQLTGRSPAGDFGPAGNIERSFRPDMPSCEAGVSRSFTTPEELPEGMYELNAEVSDRALNGPLVGPTVTVGLDHTPPRIMAVDTSDIRPVESRSQFNFVVDVEEDFSGLSPGEQSSRVEAVLSPPMGPSRVIPPAQFVQTGSKTWRASFTIENYAEGRHTLSATVVDRAGNQVQTQGLSFVAHFSPAPDLSAAFMGAEGGTLALPDSKVSISFPPGALAFTTPVGLFRANEVALGEIGSSFEIVGMEGVSLQQCVLATIKYNDQPVGRNVLNENLVEIQRFDEMLSTWVPVPTTVDIGSNTATAQLCHFSPFRAAVRNLQWKEKAVGLDDILASAPSAFLWNGQVQVVARRANGNLWHAWMDQAGVWHSNGEVITNSPIASAPAGFTWTDGNMQVVALTADGKLWHAWRNEYGVWSAYRGILDFGGIAGGGISGFVWTDGWIQTVSLLVDPSSLMVPDYQLGSGLLTHAFREANAGWGAQTVQISDKLTSAPSGFFWKDGYIQVVARGPTGHLWHGFREGYGGWHSQGEALFDHPLTSAPSGFMGPSPDLWIQVLALGPNSTLWHTWRENYGGWITDGEVLNAKLNSAPSGVLYKERIHVVALSSENKLWYARQEASVCGNTQCEQGETCTSCSQDCCPPPSPPPGAQCGNSVCESGESCSSNCPDCCPSPSISSFSIDVSGSLAGNRLPFSNVCNPTGLGPTSISPKATVTNGRSARVLPVTPTSPTWDNYTCIAVNSASGNPWSPTLCTKVVTMLTIPPGEVANPSFELTVYGDDNFTVNPVKQSINMGRTVFNPAAPDSAWGSQQQPQNQWPPESAYVIDQSDPDGPGMRNRFLAFWQKGPAGQLPSLPAEESKYKTDGKGFSVAIQPKAPWPLRSDSFFDRFELKVQLEPPAPSVVVEAHWLDPMKLVGQRTMDTWLQCQDANARPFSNNEGQPQFVIPIYFDESGQQRVPKLMFTFKNKNGSRAEFVVDRHLVPYGTFGY